MQDEKDYRIEGFDPIECNRCMNFSWRKEIGASPNGRRKYYQDEKGKAWRGKICPSCASKDHTNYMREYRRKKRS